MKRIPAERLRAFGEALLARAGLEQEKAATVADILLEGDLMGHSTHGFQLLAPYVKDVAEGRMTRAGAPKVIAERGATMLWDGDYLPGPWLVVKALEYASSKVGTMGSFNVVIRRSHHIGALAAYMKRVTDRGLACVLTCSDPATASVAPHGTSAPLYTPNPIAAAWPTGAGPVWMDISASTTTNGMVGRQHRTGGRLPGKWLVDEQGAATDDPAVAIAGADGKMRGAILPLGGLELGHKGYALGLLVEALTAGLGGHGRADGEKRWGASVFLLVVDPQAFGGREAFERETGWLAAACRDAGARLPGERAARLREEQLELGVELHPEILPALEPWAKKFSVSLP